MNFKQLLASDKIIVSDGAMGTELEKRKKTSESCLEALSIIEPSIIQKIHKDYFEAGSDLVETNTFGANRIRLALFNQENHLKEIINQSVQIARDVCPSGKFVVGSVGPTGELPNPYGPLSVKEGTDVYRDTISVLADNNVDAIFIETMMSIEEAEMAITAANEFPEIPTLLSMTFEVKDNGISTAFGVHPEDLVMFAESNNLLGFGANCGQGFEEMLKVIKAFNTSRPLMAQANAGQPVLEGKDWKYSLDYQILISTVSAFLNSGVRIIGGCCGTDPDVIRIIKSEIDMIS